MNWSYSLRGITRAGSKGMISARNIKAPHNELFESRFSNNDGKSDSMRFQTVEQFNLFKKKRKKNSPGSGPNSFRGTKILKNMENQSPLNPPRGDSC
jgi:hypothetical protein